MLNVKYAILHKVLFSAEQNCFDKPLNNNVNRL